MASVTFDKATRLYPGSTRPAVDQIDLEVADGEFLVLVGPSGCGKSTTLRMLAGLEEVNDGRILIGDRDVTDVPPKDRDIAMVFQNYALYPHMTVADNMAFALKMAKVPAEEREKRVQEAAKILGLTEFLERKPKALSGGQRQRVAMGRAIVRSPQVFCMDEPLSNLDAKLREQMRVELRALQQRLGITTVYVTHDQEEAMVLSDEIAVMHEGRVLQVAGPETIYTRPANRTVAAFVGAPNLLEAKTREVRRAAGGTLAHVEGHGWDGWCSGPYDLAAGEPVTVIVRPEVLQFGGRPAAGITWKGVVRQRFFRGTRNVYMVEVGSHRFSVDAALDQLLAPGSEVTLSVDAAQTWAVRE